MSQQGNEEPTWIVKQMTNPTANAFAMQTVTYYATFALNTYLFVSMVISGRVGETSALAASVVLPTVATAIFVWNVILPNIGLPAHIARRLLLEITFNVKRARDAYNFKVNGKPPIWLFYIVIGRSTMSYCGLPATLSHGSVILNSSLPLLDKLISAASLLGSVSGGAAVMMLFHKNEGEPLNLERYRVVQKDDMTTLDFVLVQVIAHFQILYRLLMFSLTLNLCGPAILAAHVIGYCVLWSIACWDMATGLSNGNLKYAIKYCLLNGPLDVLTDMGWMEPSPAYSSYIKVMLALRILQLVVVSWSLISNYDTAANVDPTALMIMTATFGLSALVWLSSYLLFTYKHSAAYTASSKKVDIYFAGRKPHVKAAFCEVIEV